jgi:uncharacterized protein YbjT (DUF2867 family)
MKILVTGGTGRVGAEVVKELQKRKAETRLLVRKESDRTPKGVEVAIGDLLDPVSVQKALRGVDTRLPARPRAPVPRRNQGRGELLSRARCPSGKPFNSRKEQQSEEFNE